MRVPPLAFGLPGLLALWYINIHLCLLALTSLLGWYLALRLKSFDVMSTFQLSDGPSSYEKPRQMLPVEIKDSAIAIPDKVDNALTHFLDCFMTSILKNLSNIINEDPEFENEVKHVLRLSVHKLIRRCSQDLILQVICDDIVRCLADHFQSCLNLLLDDQNTNQSAVLAHLYKSRRLHPSSISRSAECLYLRDVYKRIFKSDLHKEAQESPVIFLLIEDAFVCYFMQLSDLISDWDRVNLIISRVLNGSKQQFAEPNAPYVPFLYRFFSRSESSLMSSCSYKFENITQNGLIFSDFIKFLHNENAVHYIMCLVDFREMKQKSQGLSKEKFETMHSKFLNPDSPEFIPLKPQTLNDWNVVLRAYDITPESRKGRVVQAIIKELSDALEKLYFYRFLNSQKLIAKRYKEDRDFKTICEENSIFLDPSGSYSSEEEDFTAYVNNSNEHSQSVAKANFNQNDQDDRKINLSTWRVSLDVAPQNSHHSNSSSSSMRYQFVVRVNQVAPQTYDHVLSWKVLRKSEHFNSLHHRLKEYYSDYLKDVKLPIKDSFSLSSKGLEYHQKSIPGLEKYFSSLLSKPQLCQSEILHDFLRKEEPPETSSGSIWQKMASNITKPIAENFKQESGRALEISFLPKFAESTRGKPREAVVSSNNNSNNDNHIFYHNPLFADNPLMGLQSATPNPKNVCENTLESNNLHFHSFYDIIIYFIVHIYQVSSLLQKLICGPVKKLLSQFIHSKCCSFLRKQISQALHEDQVEYFLKYLHEAVFSTNKTQRSYQSKMDRKQRTLRAMLNALPPFLVQYILGFDRHQERTEILFRIMQYSRLNKHLFYVILDKILDRVYNAQSNS